MRARVIAEIGCNHAGQMAAAKAMMRRALQCGADYAKFQKRTPELRKEEWEKVPYVNPHSFGENYYEHRKALEFSAKQHEELWNYGRQIGIPYLTSVWDIPAFDAVRHLPMDWVKVPSACNEDWDLLEHIAREWKRPVHISNGMLDRRDILEWRTLFGDRLVVYSCTSTYPCPMKDVKLGDIDTSSVQGFSGHHNGIALDIAAQCLGAQFIERHFTLDRTAKGTDHAASLGPEGLTKLVRDLEAVDQAMGCREGLAPGEAEMALKLKKGKTECPHPS